MRVRFHDSIASALFHYNAGDEADVPEGDELTAWLDTGVCEPAGEEPPESTTMPSAPETTTRPPARKGGRKHP